MSDSRAEEVLKEFQIGVTSINRDIAYSKIKEGEIPLSDLYYKIDLQIRPEIKKYFRINQFFTLN